MTRWVLVFMTVVGTLAMTSGCARTVNVTKDGREIETLSHGYLRGERKNTCEEVSQFDVLVSENEKSGSAKSTVAEIKAKNQAARDGATHVLIWPEKTVSCDATGKPDEAGEKECLLFPVTAYTCVVGRHD